MMFKAIGRNGMLLGIFALITTLVIAGTWLNTRDRIAAQQRAAEERALLEIVPLDRHDNAMLDDTLPVSNSELLNLNQEENIHIARMGGEFVAAIIPVIAPDGYSGEIRLIVGINADGSVAGTRVIAHRETPGLGDKVELRKSDWILSFDGHSLTNPKPEQWTVLKDGGVFDQFTGATITPRAVTNAVYRALLFFEKNRQQLVVEK